MSGPRQAELSRQDVRRILQLRQEVVGERHKLTHAWNAKLQF